MAGVSDTIWLHRPGLDVGIPSDLIKAAAETPGVRCVVVEGRYGHISFVLDPFQQTADTDLSNNAFPRQPSASRFELFQQQQQAQPNPMQQNSSSMQKLEQKPGGTK